MLYLRVITRAAKERGHMVGPHKQLVASNGLRTAGHGDNVDGLRALHTQDVASHSAGRAADDTHRGLKAHSQS